MRNLKLLVTPFDPWMILNNKYDCKGIACDIFKFIARSMNFTFELIAEEKTAHGYKLPDGNWTGTIGFFQRGVSKFKTNLCIFISK